MNRGVWLARLRKYQRLLRDTSDEKGRERVRMVIAALIDEGKREGWY